MSSKLSPKTNKSKYATTRSDIRFYKMSLLFFAVCAVIFFVLKVMESLNFRISTGKNLSYELYTLFRNPVYIAAAAALFVGATVWMILSKVKKTDEGMKIISGTNAFVIMAYVVWFSAYYGVQGRLLPAESVFVIAITVVLALIYYISRIYNNDFLAFSVENAILAVLLYKYQSVSGNVGIIGKILLIIAFSAIGFVLVKLLKNDKSRFTASKNQSLLMFPYFVSLAVWAVCMFIPSTLNVATGILLTVMLVQYIVFAIVYTVKLIKE